MAHPAYFCSGYHGDTGHCTVYSLRWEPQRGGCCRAQPGPSHLHSLSFLSSSVFWITGASIGAHNSKKCDRRTGEAASSSGEVTKSLYPQVLLPLTYQVACWSAYFTMRDQPINTGLAFINFKLVLMPLAYYLWKILKGSDKSLIVGRMGKGAFTTLKLRYFYLHLAEQYSPSFVRQFLQNTLIDIFKHLLYMVLQFCFVVFFFS